MMITSSFFSIHVQSLFCALVNNALSGSMPVDKEEALVLIMTLHNMVRIDKTTL